MTYAADGQRRRGRPPRISRDHIVDAACEVGIENLTMAAVAERLGVTHQSLYGWVQDRDELIDLVSDRLIQRLEILPPASPEDWRNSSVPMPTAFVVSLRRRQGLPAPAWAAFGRSTGLRSSTTTSCYCSPTSASNRRWRSASTTP